MVPEEGLEKFLYDFDKLNNSVYLEQQS